MLRRCVLLCFVVCVCVCASECVNFQVNGTAFLSIVIIVPRRQADGRQNSDNIHVSASNRSVLLLNCDKNGKTNKRTHTYTHTHGLNGLIQALPSSLGHTMNMSIHRV